MGEFKQVTKTVLARVTCYGRKPTTEAQALRQARLLLEEEGRWCAGDLFTDGDAGEVFENGSLCGTWQACAAGAVGLVTGDMPIKITKEWYTGDTSVYDDIIGSWDEPDYSWENPDESEAFAEGTMAHKTLQVLAIAIAVERRDLVNADGLWKFDGDVDLLIDHPQEIVFGGNDESNRDAVVEYFRKAEDLAKNKKLLTRIRRDLGLETYSFWVDVSAGNQEDAARVIGDMLKPTETDEYVITYGVQ